MSSELAGWLRRQRQNRGWPIAEMARQLRRAALDSGDHTVPDSNAMCRNIRRWENGNGGVSERHKLHYCRALGIQPEEFGPKPPRPPQAAGHLDNTAAGPAAMPVSAAIVTGQLVPHLASAAVIPATLTPTGVAYRWLQEPDPGDPTVEREVLMAAHEGSHHAEQAERRDIGDATLEQLRADVIRLSRQYMTGEPLPLFLEMRRVRSRMHAALDRRLWPRDASELYFLLGGLNGLMSKAAQDLGYPEAAEELVRAGWAYATVIDHHPLLGFLRGRAASISYWRSRPRRASELALDGLRYRSEGPGAAQLHLLHAQAAAEIGDAQGTRNGVAAAEDAGRAEGDELQDEIGGDFRFTAGKQAYLAGSALIGIPGDEAAAIGQLRSAIAVFETGPVQDRSYGCEAIARINLALARLRSGGLDAVDLEPVLTLTRDRRIDALPQRLLAVRSELAKPGYQGAAGASDLDERIEDFVRETITTELSLPAGPG